MPAWSDGRTVFIDAESAAQTRLQCVVVQAALIHAGSLDPRVLHKLARRPSAVRRYLSLEGHRALTALSDVLPTTVVSMADPVTAQRTESPQSSLILAVGSEDIPDPPVSFGVIRPRLVGHARHDRSEGPEPLAFRHKNGRQFSANSRTTLGKTRLSTFSRAPSVGAVRSDDSSSGCWATRERRGQVAQEQTLRLGSRGAVTASPA